jgi:hypothetical protein
MDMPDPKQSGLTDNSLNIPINDMRNPTPNGLYRDESNRSFAGSANRIVEDKHLGPSAMKAKVGLPRPTSKMLLSNSKRAETQDYSDEDYEDNFDDAADNGEDEMEKLRRAMEKEKKKAQNHQDARSQ